MSTTLLEILGVSQLLMLVLIFSALPWVFSLLPGGVSHRQTELADLAARDKDFSNRKIGSYSGIWSKEFWTIILAVNFFGVAMLTYLINNFRDGQKLAEYGRYYGCFLHLNLAADFFVFVFYGMLKFWPKGGAVALAAFRESVRSPMYWVICLLSMFLLVLSMLVPYFTFGEDYKVFKQMSFDIVMFAALLFGMLAISISVYEEIEGRTAITVMSKPISRRQFMIGKYLGILLASGAMMMILGWLLTWTLYIQPRFNKLDDVIDYLPIEMTQKVGPLCDKLMFTPEGQAVTHGVGIWFGETLAHHLGLLLTFGQVMVLLAISAALATRMPFAINIVICLMVFLLGHLSPVLASATERLGDDFSLMLVGFIAKLFNVVFPALDYFQFGPAIIRENPIPIWSFTQYVLTIVAYAILYSTIAILIGLLLFEDRDLA